MPTPKTIFRTDNKKLVVGIVPRVAGVLCSLHGKFPPGRGKPQCDLVEVRLDITGRPKDWVERCQAIQTGGWPVLLTIRLDYEGGKWSQADEKRLGIFEEGLKALAAVDVEWRSKIAKPVARMAKRLGKVCVVSYHDFKKTPPARELEKIITQAQKIASVVKISTRLNSSSDEQVLQSLLSKKRTVPLCVIGMGPDWAHTRVQFPRLGSCLAYGYLDKATAPGQLSAAQLTRQLRSSKSLPNS